MIADGHELGSHSVNHPHLKEISNKQVWNEVQGCCDLLLQNHNYQTRLFRPPYGVPSDISNAVCDYLGLKVVNWGLTVKDSRESTTAKIVMDMIYRYTEPGDIIIFHNGSKFMEDTLEPILDYLIEQGYSFGTVSELMGWEDGSLSA